MSKVFYRAEQGKRASGAGPLALHPIPRSGETRYLGKTLTEIGTYNGGRSQAYCNVAKKSLRFCALPVI
jgi:hypothetical protein